MLRWHEHALPVLCEYGDPQFGDPGSHNCIDLWTPSSLELYGCGDLFSRELGLGNSALPVNHALGVL